MKYLKTYQNIELAPTILDTSRDDSEYFRMLSRALEHYPYIRLMHYEPNPNDNARMVHATALNIGRELTLKGDYDFMLSMEADVVPRPMDFITLFEMKADLSIRTGIVPYSKNATMIYKTLAVNYRDGRLTQPCSIPTIQNNKSFWTELEVEQFREAKWLPQCEFYHLDEIKSEEPFEVAGCSLGFTLISRRVLEEIHFRYIEASGAFPDVWFCWDAIRSGHRIICNPNARPRHLWRSWPREMER